MGFADQQEARQQKAGTVKAGTPFRRAMLMSQEVMFASMLAEHLRGAAFAAIGPYESRGKGGKRSKTGKSYGGTGSKYQPHIGAKEHAKFAARNP